MVSRETRTILEGLAALKLPLSEEERGAAAARLAGLHDLLADEGIRLGFVGASERDRLVPRHILESAALLPHVGPSGAVVDVGSGAGLPGLVLAALRSGPVTLLDAERRRTLFVQRAGRKLGLSVGVISMRAEIAGHEQELREVFDVAVARALAPPPTALELLLPLVRVGGRAILLVGPTDSGDAHAVRRASEELGGGSFSLESLAIPGRSGATWAMVVPKVRRTPSRFPRRPGVPSRRPLGST